MKYVSIFSVTLKSAITPSFIGLMATTFPGVRPSISFASRPTATTSPLFLLIATIEGSLTTIPLPFEYTSVFAVPRSIARSEENKLKTDLMLYPFFDVSTLRNFGSKPFRARRREAGARHCLRNYDVNTLRRCAAAAILSGNRNCLAATFHRIGEETEFSIGGNIRHSLP